MKPDKWKTISAAAAEGEYLVVASYLSLTSALKLPEFLWYSLRVLRQLGTAKGLLGYSTQAALWRRKFWTLSVWQNEAMLREFVEQAAHGKSMKRFERHIHEAKAAQWQVAGRSLPPDWQDAKERLAHAPDTKHPPADHSAEN